MTTRRSLKPGQFLLVGRLYFHADRGRALLGEPYLGLEVICSFCHDVHHHSWRDLESSGRFRSDEV